MSSTADRAARRREALPAIITAVSLVLVWLVEAKSVPCLASGSGPCAADARLVPALITSASLLVMLGLALLIAFLVPEAHRQLALRVVNVVLVIAGLVSIGIVLFSAGFALWPPWL